MSAKVAGLILAPLVVGATIVYGATHKDTASALLGSTEGIFQVIRDNARAYAGFLDEAEHAKLVYIRGFARSLLDVLYVNPDDVPEEDRIKMLELTFKEGGKTPPEDIKAALGPIANGMLAVGAPSAEEEPLLLTMQGKEVPDRYFEIPLSRMKGGVGAAESIPRSSSSLSDNDPLNDIRALFPDDDGSEGDTTDSSYDDTSSVTDRDEALQEDAPKPPIALYAREGDVRGEDILMAYFKSDYFNAESQADELSTLKDVINSRRSWIEKADALNPFKPVDPTSSIAPLPPTTMSGGGSDSSHDDIALAMHVVKPYIPMYLIKLARIVLYQYMAIHNPLGSFSWRWLFADLAITLVAHAVLVTLDLMPFDLEAVLTDASFGMIVISCLTIIMNVVQPDVDDEASVATKIDAIVSHISPYILLVPTRVMRDA